MFTNFNIVSGETVPKTYSWDIGEPLYTTPTKQEIKTVTNVISGYSPALRVAFLSDIRNLPFTTSNVTILSTEYIWNFGDYYNDVSNEITTRCSNTVVEHTYVMPGVYEISLTTAVARELIPDPILTPRCYGKYRQGWYWDAVTCDVQTATDWQDTECDSLTKPKIWVDEDSCFGEYCKYWAWWTVDKEGTGALNPVRWFQTRRAEEFTKKWPTGVNLEPCEKELKSTFDVVEQTTVKQIVVVEEIPPVANLAASSNSLKGESPLPVQLTPRYTKAGSFPIDKIIWDFGDGSPLLTITRYTAPNDINVINTNTFFDDPQDPRNYDVTHIYKRTKASNAMFYPSLTCFSANTHTHDSCSMTIGPVSLEESPQDYKIVAASINDKGILYGIDTNNSINFLTPSTTPTITQTINTPTNELRFTTDFQVRYFGNPGNNDFSLRYISTCQAPFAPRPALNYLILEESGNNLLYYSEEFDNTTYWDDNNLTITPNVILAPNNTTTADLAVMNATTSTFYIYQNYPLWTAGTTYTQSWYVKSAGISWIQVSGSTGTSIGPFQNINLTNGQLGNGTYPAGTVKVDTIGDGWYRVSVTVTASTTTASGRVLLILLTSNHNGRLPTTTGNGASGIYIWGAQLEANTIATNYTQTTNTRVTEGEKSLLLEDGTLIYK